MCYTIYFAIYLPTLLFKHTMEMYHLKIPQYRLWQTKATEECGIFPQFWLHDDAGGTQEIKSRIVTAKAAFNKKKQNHFTSNLDFTLRKKSVICNIWNVALYGAKTYDTS